MALSTYLTPRRPRSVGESYFQVNGTTTVATTAQSLVPAKASRYGVISKLVVSAPTFVKFSLVYGSTTIMGPVWIAKGTPFEVPCDVMCAVVNKTIKMSTAATATITVYGKYHYEEYVA